MNVIRKTRLVVGVRLRAFPGTSAEKLRRLGIERRDEGPARMPANLEQVVRAICLRELKEGEELEQRKVGILEFDVVVDFD